MKKLLLILSLFVLALPVSSSATILTFDGFSDYDYEPISSHYGDRVTAVTDSYGSYLQGNGFTPNITVSYNTVGYGAYLEAWASGYGDLTNVAYADVNDAVAEITFTADPGYLVRINSFDLAGYYLSDKTAAVIEVIGGASPWVPASLQIEGTNGHSSYYPDIVGTQLTIRWGNDWNTGIDNINFDQMVAGPAVPIPGTMFLLFLGALGLSGINRKS